MYSKEEVVLMGLQMDIHARRVWIGNWQETKDKIGGPQNMRIDYEWLHFPLLGCVSVGVLELEPPALE